MTICCWNCTKECGEWSRGGGEDQLLPMTILGENESHSCHVCHIYMDHINDIMYHYGMSYNSIKTFFFILTYSLNIIYLSIYLPIYLPIYLSIYLHLSIYTYLSTSIYLHLSTSTYIYIYVFIYIYIFIYIHIYLHLHLSIYIYIYLHPHRPASTSIFLSIYPSFYLI